MSVRITVSDRPPLALRERFPALPPRPMHWVRALKALSRLMRKEYDSVGIQEFACALDGGDGERAFQRFLREPGADRLLAELPDLPALLDDRAGLAAMTAGSLGRAFLALAERDGIAVRALAEAARRLPDDAELHPDATRRWFGDRGIASHDLLHVLTGYERHEPGEALLIAFTVAQHPMRVLRFSLCLTLLVAPKRRWLGFVADLRRAWRRGRAAAIPYAVPWEELLPLSLDEARRCLAIRPFAEVHPHGAWMPGRGGRTWERVAAAV